MIANRKFGIGMRLVATLFVSMLLLPGTVYAGDSNSSILEPVSFDKESLRFNEILTNFETVVTNPAIFKKEAETGHVKIKIMGKDLEMEIHEKSPISEVSIVTTYEGNIVGNENSSVKFTIDDAIIIGKIVIDEKTYFIEETNKTYEGKYIHVVYDKDAVKERDILEFSGCGVDDHEHNFRYMQTAENSPLIPLESKSLITVDLQTAYDTEFSNIYPRPETRIDRIIDDANEAFEPADVVLHINGFKYLSNVPSGNITDIFDYFVGAIDAERDRTRSDLAILFTGKECTGSWIGYASVYNSSSDAAYSVVQMVSAGPGSTYQANPDDRAIVTSHELGHNFGATHDEAYTWITPTNLSYYTAMWSPYLGSLGTYPNYMQLEFSYNSSSGHGNSTCDNIGNHILVTKNTIGSFRIG